MGQGADLVILDNRRSSSVCCRSSSLKSCTTANVNPSILGQALLNLPGGVKVSFSNNVAGNKNAYFYNSSNAEVVITYSPSTGGMYAYAAMSNGATFTLENCGEKGHIWGEVDLESFDEIDDVPSVPYKRHLANEDEKIELLRKLGREDTKTVATFSIKFYYTPEFIANTPDIHNFIEQVLSITNQGYVNSGVPLVATAHCIEAATINDNTPKLWYSFMSMKTTSSALRGGADAAALLVNNYGNQDGLCGKAKIENAIEDGVTVSITRRDCAIRAFTFAHEIGHNIGLRHENDPTWGPYPYGHGHFFSPHHRTIMATSYNHRVTRVNYYSSPTLIFPDTGTPTGVEGISNNVRVLMENRFALADVGDESTPC